MNKDYVELNLNCEKNRVIQLILRVLNSKGDIVYPIGKTAMIYCQDDKDVTICLPYNGDEYIVFYKEFSEGKIIKNEKTVVRTDINQVDDNKTTSHIFVKDISVIKNELANTNQSWSNQILISHNPSISWRKEDGDVSLYNLEGELLFLHGFLAQLWLELEGGIVWDKSKTILNADSETLIKAFDILIGRNLVKIFAL